MIFNRHRTNLAGTDGSPSGGASATGSGQLSLRSVFAVTWVLAFVVAALEIFQVSSALVIFPTVVAGIGTLLELFAQAHPPRRLFIRIILTSAIVGILLFILLWLYLGWPGDRKTWTMIGGGACLIALATSAPIDVARVSVNLWLTTVVGSLLATGVPSSVILDVHGSRRGYEVLDMNFVSDDDNLALLERYLGALEPMWRRVRSLSPSILYQETSVLVYSTIGSPELGQLVRLLPDDEARKQVLACLVDFNNQLRFHQGLVVAARLHLQQPPGIDARSWWKARRAFFYSEPDPRKAARAAFGISEPIRREAVKQNVRQLLDFYLDGTFNQEQGSRGGDSDFASEYWILGGRP